MSLSEVGDELRGMVERLADSRMRAIGAADQLAKLLALLTAVTRGSQHPLLEQTRAHLQAAVQRLREAAAANGEATAAIRAYMSAIGLTTELAQTPGLAEQPNRATAGPGKHDELVKRARESLSPGVPGARTQGKWVRSDGKVEELNSGKHDEWYQKAKAFAATLPAHLRAASRLAVHLEVKFAVRMREEGRTRETVVIDRPICGQSDRDRTLPFTCDKQLHHFLPPGAELTVVEHDGTRRTYRGESTQ
ncbi:DddA-like double-stranded DNA deaminase toxin [Plantactinospora sp. WMMC1484]|uniref:DddA-like double-stranded DNA deaminase toxin n=1 Tax=Plantactinospora sp. WMMC1484 TaxID=3404122 RepID=UPI003BF60AF8